MLILLVLDSLLSPSPRLPSTSPSSSPQSLFLIGKRERCGECGRNWGKAEGEEEVGKALFWDRTLTRQIDSSMLNLSQPPVLDLCTTCIDLSRAFIYPKSKNYGSFFFGMESPIITIDHLRSFMTLLLGTEILKPKKVMWSWKGCFAFLLAYRLLPPLSALPGLTASLLPGCTDSLAHLILCLCGHGEAIHHISHFLQPLCPPPAPPP